MNRAPHRPLLATLLVLAAGGCTLVNAPGAAPEPEPVAPPAEAVDREFAGQLSVQGTSLPVVLFMTIRGEEVEEARLSVPELSMEARGGGAVRDGRLTLRLDYGDGCEGTARIDGRLGSDGYVFEGVLQASDCTGSEEGGLILRRRSGG